MDELDSISEVARFRRRQALEEEAMCLGLYGFAEVARHERINARMMRGAEHVLDLIAEGKHGEAQALMNQENWGVWECCATLYRRTWHFCPGRAFQCKKSRRKRIC